MSRRLVAAALVVALAPTAAAAQLAVVHLGGLASYGMPSGSRAGAGLIVGVAPGRLVYAGVRGVYYTGATERRTDTAGAFDVRTRSQLLAADLGLEFPAGALEIVGGVTIGITRFEQRTSPVPGQPTTATTSEAGTELLVAPNLSVQIRMARLLLIPELMYCLAGSPNVRWPVTHRGPLFGIRVIVPFEVGRIRH